MRDIVLEETIYLDFTTRSFTTGVPTVLAGTPVLSVLEENNATPITAGVSVSVDRASVVGLNMATIVATAANGYENGKGYSVYISTGTVGGVSVVGEKVAEFTIGASAAAQDLANGTDGLGAIKTDTAAILVDTGTTLDGKINTIDTNVDSILVDTAEIGTAGAGLTDLGGMSTAMKAEVNAEADTALTDYDGPTNTEMNARTVTSATYATSAAQTTAQNDLDIITGASGVNLLTATQASIDAIEVDTAAMQPLVAKIPLSDGAITWNSTALASINAECDTAISDASLATASALATVDTNVDAILVDTAAMQPLVAKIPLSDGVITWNSTALASINAECDTAITDAALATAAALATVDTNVDSILVDTADMQPKLGTPAADISADIAAVKADAAATLADTVILTSVFTTGAAITGTLSTTQMSTDLTEVTDDHYIGRLITWTSGVLAGQQTDITDYTGSTKVLTYTATTDAPSNTDTFVIT